MLFRSHGGEQGSVGRLAEAGRFVRIGLQIADVFRDPLNVARLMEDLAENGRLDDEELKPLVKQWAEAAQAALV